MKIDFDVAKQILSNYLLTYTLSVWDGPTVRNVEIESNDDSLVIKVNARCDRPLVTRIYKRLSKILPVDVKREGYYIIIVRNEHKISIVAVSVILEKNDWAFANVFGIEYLENTGKIIGLSMHLSRTYSTEAERMLQYKSGVYVIDEVNRSACYVDVSGRFTVDDLINMCGSEG